MKNTSISLNQNRLFTAIGWIHATLFFCGVFPLFASLSGTPEERLPLYFGFGLLTIVPVVTSYLSIRNIKYLFLYFAAGTLFTAGITYAVSLAANTVPDENSLVLPVLTFLTGAFLFLYRGYIRIKKGRLQKEFQNLPNSATEKIDYDDLEVPSFLDHPSPVHFAWFFVLYVVSALRKTSFCWHVFFWLLFIDLFLCFIYLFVDSFHDFIKQHIHAANLPIPTMKKITRAIFALFFVILFCFTLPAIFYGNEKLGEMTFKEPSIKIEIPEDEEAPSRMPHVEEDTTFVDLENAVDAQSVIPEWVGMVFQIILYGIVLAGAVALIWGIIQAIRSAGKYFAEETEDEITFLDKGFRDRAVFSKKKDVRGRELPANIQIRKHYKKLIKKSLKNQIPRGSETPLELERNAGFPDSSDSRELLHSYYERARYSQNGCTPADVETVKHLSL